MRLAARAAPLAADMVPADAIDFFARHQEMSEDLAASIVVAMLKEPTATSEFLTQWRTMPNDYTAHDLHAALKAAISVTVSTPGSSPDDSRAQHPRHTVELQQLGRRGVCRFLGSVIVAQSFGIMRKARATETGFIAGLQGNQYVWVPDTPGSVVAKFLGAVREHGDASELRPPCFDAGATRDVTDLVTYAAALRGMLTRVGARVPSLMLKGTGKVNYVLDSIVRKHVLARAGGVDWSQCTLAELRRLSVDQCEFLAELPDDWQATDASSLICDRPEWPLLVSMYMCLWHDVEKTIPDALPMLTKAVHSGEAMAKITEFRRRHGFAPHPHTLMKMLTPEKKNSQTKGGATKPR